MQGENISPENPPSITSRTITHLSITVTATSASPSIFDIIYHSTMPSLNVLRLQVAVDEEWECCEERPEQRLRAFYWDQQYSSLASGHLIIVGRTFTLIDGVCQEITSTIMGSRFLNWCLSLSILTVEWHECDASEINPGQKPDAEWKSEGGLLHAVIRNQDLDSWTRD
jgi:hypothetical protein